MAGSSQCTAHMKVKNKPRGYWTFETTLKSAQKFTTQNEWDKHFPGAVAKAQTKGWMKQCTAHMIKFQKPPGYWAIKENVIETAKGCSTLKEWRTTYSSAYTSSRKNGWYDECLEHIRAE